MCSLSQDKYKRTALPRLKFKIEIRRSRIQEGPNSKLLFFNTGRCSRAINLLPYCLWPLICLSSAGYENLGTGRLLDPIRSINCKLISSGIYFLPFELTRAGKVTNWLYSLFSIPVKQIKLDENLILWNEKAPPRAAWKILKKVGGPLFLEELFQKEELFEFRNKFNFIFRESPVPTFFQNLELKNMTSRFSLSLEIKKRFLLKFRRAVLAILI